MRNLARIAAILITSASGNALAATATTTFQAKIVINASCVINNANLLDFGTPVPGILSSNIDAATTLSVTCTNLTPFTLGLDGGLNSGGSVSARKMKGGPANELINYAIYRDTLRTLNWGVTISGTPDVVSSTGSGVAQTFNVYGRVPGPQTTPQPGTYTDTVTLTLTY